MFGNLPPDMKFERPPISSICGLGAVLLASLLTAVPAPAQLPGPPAPAQVGLDQQAFMKGQAEFQAQKYAEAAKLFEGIAKDFPTSGFVSAGRLQAAVCYYFLGDFDRGVLTLRTNISGKNVPPEVVEDSSLLIPQLLTAKAQKLPEANDGRKATLEQAVKDFDAFIAKFPQSLEQEQANLGKARALFGLKKYDEAMQVLRAALQKYPNSDSTMDTQFFLALALATQANELLRAGVAGKVDDANRAYDEAEKTLREIVAITRRNDARADLAMMNEAQFQLGEILAARGSFAERGEKQDAILTKSLEAYRATYAKEIVVQAQTARIKGFQDRLREEGVKGEVLNVRHLQATIQREQAKLADLQSRPDQTLAAKLKSAQIQITMHKAKERERMDEARVLLRFVDRFAKDLDEDQRKQILYFQTLTYAAQHLSAKAEEFYEKWKTTYKDDSIGENLPLVMGAMYLDPDPAINNPAKGIEYFKKQLTDFPKSKFGAEAVMQQALAMIQLKQFDEATKTLEGFLASKPDKDLAAAAEFGLATVYKDTGKTDQAVKTFRDVREKYSDLPQAEQAAYFVGQLLQSSGKPEEAITDINAFLAKYGTSDFAPSAMLTLGQAQAGAGKRDEALATFVSLAGKYKTSEQAPYAYFQRSAIYQSEGKFAEAKGAMREFIAAYPDSPKRFQAYDYISQIETLEKHLPEAIANYEEYAKKFPESPSAATAMLRIAELWRKTTDAMGRYSILPEASRPEWKKNVDNTRAAAEALLEKYPDSAEAAQALQLMLYVQKQLVAANARGTKNVEEYFNEMAKKFADRPSLASKIKFTLAGYYFDKNRDQAIKQMRVAYDEKLVYATTDLDAYASALLEQGRYDDVEAVAEKLIKDYPLPPNIDIEKLPRSVTEGASLSLFYKAKVLQLTKKTAEAAAKFDELKKKFPYSPKLAEADLGIAGDLFKQKKYPEALELATPVAKATTASPEVRARAMMLIGQICEDQGDIDAAINNFIKISIFFEGLPELAAEGLWRGAQLQEKKASGQVVQKAPAATPAPEATPAAAKGAKATPARK